MIPKHFPWSSCGMIPHIHMIPYDTTYPISGALTFMVLAAALVTASFLMSPVIEDVFGNVFYTRQRKFSSNEDEKYFQCTARWTIQVLMLQTTLVILPGKSWHGEMLIVLSLILSCNKLPNKKPLMMQHHWCWFCCREDWAQLPLPQRGRPPPSEPATSAP